MTSERCRIDAPPVVVRVPERRASAGCAWAAIHAGATPKRMPVRSERPNAKSDHERRGSRIDGNILRAGKGHGEQHMRSGIGHSETGNTSESREQNALSEQLADDAAALRSKGRAHAHLGAAAHAAD